MKNKFKLLWKNKIRFIVFIVLTIVTITTTFVVPKAQWDSANIIERGKLVIRGDSMEPTIKNGQIVYVSDVQTERGSIVAVKSHSTLKYPNTDNPVLLKRVVGLPGETVEIIEGQTYINGEALDEPYLKEEMLGSFGPYEVPEGSYFVMGDNRNESSDARYWENTYVKEEKILGKAVLRLFPNPTMLH